MLCFPFLVKFHPAFIKKKKKKKARTDCTAKHETALGGASEWNAVSLILSCEYALLTQATYRRAQGEQLAVLMQWCDCRVPEESQLFSRPFRKKSLCLWSLQLRSHYLEVCFPNPATLFAGLTVCRLRHTSQIFLFQYVLAVYFV